MEVGKRVYCKSDALKLDNAQGTVTRTRVLGCTDSVTVLLDNGKQVAFFGPKTGCVANGPLSKDPTMEVKQVKKRVSRKKVSV